MSHATAPPSIQLPPPPRTACQCPLGFPRSDSLHATQIGHISQRLGGHSEGEQDHALFTLDGNHDSRVFFPEFALYYAPDLKIL